MQLPLPDPSASDPISTRVLVGVTIFVFGAIFSHLWNRLRQRLVTLTWTADWTRVALAGEDPHFGKVEVRYNDVPVKNSQLVNVVVHNESTVDLKDLVVVVGFNDDTTVLWANGYLAGSPHTLDLHQPYLDAATKRITEGASATELGYFFNHRDYFVPVFNRGGTLHFTVFVNREDFVAPVVQVTCDHLGVQVRNRVPGAEFWGVPFKRAQILGLLLTLLLSIVIALAPIPAWGVSLSSWFLGICAILIGAALVRAGRSLLRLLS